MGLSEASSYGLPQDFDPEAFVEKAPWTFARSVPHIPHWYTKEGDTPAEEFWAFYHYIQRHGYRARWRESASNYYLELGEWKYWCLPGYPWWKDGEERMIINRERLPGELLDKDP
jgi:hypothetical protein